MVLLNKISQLRLLRQNQCFPMYQTLSTNVPRETNRPLQTCKDEPYFSPKPIACVDLSKIELHRGTMCHERMVRSFLFRHFWPREPSCAGLYMPLNSPYLSILTDKYTCTGQRFLAFEVEQRSKELKLLGVAHGEKVMPWTADEYDVWANSYDDSCFAPERTRLFFQAHVLRSPKLFEKYKVPYIYTIDCIATTPIVGCVGVGTLLFQYLLVEALDRGHPLIQMISTSSYTHRICERSTMKKAWEMDYRDFTNSKGMSVFYPRLPHSSVRVYILELPKDNLITWLRRHRDLYDVYVRHVCKRDTWYTVADPPPSPCNPSEQYNPPKCYK